MFNIDNLIQKAHSVVKSHYLGNGAYARHLWQNEAGTRLLAVNPYGCADALHVLYMINELPTGDEAKACVKALQDLQDPETGLFTEVPPAYYMHATAQCLGALDLFGAKPKYPQKTTLQFFTKEGLKTLMDSIRWQEAPWKDSHLGAGVYAIGVMTDNVDLEWQNYYFDILYDETDPEWGMSRKGTILTGDNPAPLFHHLNGWFHYMFNIQYAKRPLKYPEKLIDTCIKMYREKLLHPMFARSVGFSEIDWVYPLNRATRETPHRFEEAKAVLCEFADEYIPYLESLDFATHDSINDMNPLCGVIACLAELQNALPGYIESSKPLRLVLDRRPFI